MANSKRIGKILPSLWDEKDINRNLKAQFVKLHEQKCIPLFCPTLTWLQQVIMNMVMYESITKYAV